MSLLETNTIPTTLFSALNKEGSTSLLALFLKGGWVMLPILLLSILTVYAFLERLIVLYRTARIPQRWIDEIKIKTIARDTLGVKMLCGQKRHAMARIIQVGIDKINKPSKALKAAIENAGQNEIYRLEKNLPLLGTIAGAAPMLGFLGTVLGMIQAFMTIAQETHQVSPKMLSEGIYEAMITTAAGLIVGITANLGYNYLLVQVQKATQRIEHASNEFIALVESYPATAQPNNKPNEAAQ